MSFETDLLIDRRRLKRRLILWRAVAVLTVLACAVLVLAPSLPFASRTKSVGRPL